MSILVLTGPPASGKNTVADTLAKHLDRCAVIDVDALHQMVVQPNHSPWDGDEGASQQMLGVRNTCALIHNFEADGFDTVVVDTLTEESAALYRQRLKGEDMAIVQLLPSEDEINRRLLSRPDYLSRGDNEWLYGQQAAFTGFDQRVENTLMSPEDAALSILQNWPAART